MVLKDTTVSLDEGPSFQLVTNTDDKWTTTLLKAEAIVHLLRDSVRGLQLREIMQKQDSDTKEANQLAYIAWSAILDERNQVSQLSGFIWYELHNINPLLIDSLRNQLSRDPYTFLLCTNLADTGLILVVRTDLVASDEFNKYIHNYGTRLRRSYQLETVKILVPSNPTRRCSLGFDLQPYLNNSSQVWTPTNPPILQETVKANKADDQGPLSMRDRINQVLTQQVDKEMEHLVEPESNVSPQNKGRQVGPFPTQTFPDPLQRVIQQTSLHMNFRPDWIGASILYAVSVAVGNAYGTRYKSYEQKALMYLAIVGMPGTNKSSPLEYAVKPFRNVDKIAYYQYNQRKGEKLAANQPLPAYQTTLISDVTQEFLIQTLENNPIGLGLVMDELAGWFKNFTRYNKGSEEQFWLSVWSFAPVKSGRKTSGVQHVDNPYLTVAGTIQPGVLSELAKDGRNQNGFIDRILFAYPDDQQKNKDSDTELDPAITSEYHRLIKKLLTLRNSVVVDEYGSVETKWIPFEAVAFNRMRQWRDDNTDRSNQTTCLGLKGIYAKFDAYCIRFALLIELMKWACDQSDLTQIESESVEQAIELADYFRQNAEKVYHELHQKSDISPLSSVQQRLLDSLPDQMTTSEAVNIGKSLTPPISESTVKRLLGDDKVFEQVKHGTYRKRHN